MYILSVDTALGKESCAISRYGNVIAYSAGDESQLQAEKLFSHIEKVMKEAGTDYSKIDYFAVNLGPGSFTGIRIGLSAITAIAHAADKKLIGISSLEALGFKVWNKYGIKNIPVAIDAGRGEAYYQEFTGTDGVFGASTAAELTGIERIIFAEAGNIAECKVKMLPDARDICSYAFELMKTGKADFMRKEPIYLRKPDAKIKANHV